MNETTTDAAAIFAPLWKRKWLILLVGIVVAAGTYVYYKHRPSVYGASTELYLGGNAEIQSLVGAGEVASSQSNREDADQAELINSNVIGEAVLRKLGEEHKLAVANGSVKASSVTESDFITLSAESGSAQGAALLANTYAEVYLAEREAKYRTHIKQLIDETQRSLQSAEAHSPKFAATSSAAVQALNERLAEYESELSSGAGDRHLNPAVPNPVALSPKPKKNAIFGFAIGILLAALAAYVLSRSDRRLRSLDDVESVLRAPILTALPSNGHPIVHRDGVPAANELLREPLRRLHTTLQLQAMLKTELGSSPRSVLFVSAEAGAGKSTLIAGLALVQREAGQRVAVIDADLRRPAQTGLLDVDGSPGLTEVLADKLPLGEALQTVEAGMSADPTQASGSLVTAVQTRELGSVSVLASGSETANPPALLAGRGVRELLRSVTGEFDHVLVDAPPPLEVSDVMPLLRLVDAVIIVARVGHTRRTAAERLVQLLERSASAPVLGVVVNDVPSSDIEAYGLSSAYYDKR